MRIAADYLVRTSILATAAMFACTLAAPAFGQETQWVDVPYGNAEGGNSALVTADTPTYMIPDVVPEVEEDVKFFTLKPGLVVILDWTTFRQEDESFDQLGLLEDEFQVRSSRLSLRGTIGRDYQVSYIVSAEFKGFDGDPDTDWSLTDLALTFPIGDRTKLSVGKVKETFSYEMVGDSANLPHSERELNPFFVSRNFGFKVISVLGADKRATISAGAFKDSWDINSSTDRGWDYTFRATALPWGNAERHQFLHLGVAYRHAAIDEYARYRGRAESNVGEYFVDTGEFEAKNADHFGAEALLNIGSVSFTGEYVLAKVNSDAYDDPVFSGWYVTGSWFPLGDNRPYDRNVGYARRVIPKNSYGAPEVVARFASVDLDDNGINGGKFDKTMVGLNWWATTRWKLGVTWGHTWLDRFGIVGESDTILGRIQWVY